MRSRSGQSALFDAFAFLIVMLIAFTVLFVYASSLAWEHEVSARAEETIYTQRALQALMRTSVCNLTYTDPQGTVNVSKGEMSVEAFLVQEAALVSSGADPQGFTEANERISGIVDELLGEQRGFALVIEIEEERITIPDLSLPAERCAASVDLASSAGEITITLYTWRL
ncbi:MAG: hypothetical protein AB1665_09255 [Candidatus Thermoplasmatota archaeon]